MSTHRKIDLICVVVILLSVLLTVLFMNGERLGITPIIDEDAEVHSGSVYFTNNDLNGDWDTASATVITLRGDTASVSGGGAYAYNGSVYISNAGRYVVSGTLTDGSIVVDAKRSSKVWILLNGADIYCSDSAGIQVRKADKVFLTLADGTENRVACGSEFSQTALEDNIKGALFASDDLTINGSGSLTVTSGYRHAIAANDDLVITGGHITAEAPRDAIHVNDSLRICRAELTLTAGDEGIDVDKEGGYLFIESGVIGIDSTDDGIHTEGDILIAGGEVRIRSGDDGIHSNTTVYIYGGEITLERCYEGIEGVAVELHGGEVTIYPEDDGVNANGFVLGGMGAQSGVSVSVEDTYVLVAGGSLTIVNENAQDADGIDSNGGLYVTGGSVFVSLPDGSPNTALDYGSESGGAALITGGTVVACGSYSMAEAFDADSTQCSILYNIAAGVASGTEVRLLDADRNELLCAEIPCSFSSVILSCPGMELGGTYYVVIGESAEEITLTETSASFGDARSAMFGGSMNWGGMRSWESFGGRGGNGPGNEGAPELPEGERPESPDGFTPPDGERPELPEGFTPSEGEPPELPEGFTPSATADASDGTAEHRIPGSEEMPDIRRQEADTAAAAQTADDEETLAARRTLFIVSAGALALGILAAAAFRKRIAL
ncbi:MAG: carbohydrate-binding domain-containing protein [Oscillospiraceae bacterium]|nr:carbohydrate-binding domain-containing protein [Oscillospiraceae bacterium]